MMKNQGKYKKSTNLYPIYSFYLNENLSLIKKSKSTVTRPDMIDYELCEIQFMEEKNE